MSCYMAVCAWSELTFPTGTLHFQALVTQATNGEKIVRAFGTTASAKGELSYWAPLGSENISAPYFNQCFFRRGGY